MHKKNFVAAIKVGGKVLRESSDRVELPFGSEYSILLKNLDSVRMQAQITIDGQDATGWLVLNPNSSMDVERFVKHLDRGNRFKFIERTEQIENHRGIKADDGLVRIEFKREKVYEAPQVVEHHTYNHHIYNHRYCYSEPCFRPYNPWITYTSNSSPLHNTVTATSGMRSGVGVRNLNFIKSANASSGSLLSANAVNMTSVQNEAGITVPGSESQQKFVYVSGFETEPSQVIVLHLVGRTGAIQVTQPKTVDIRVVCQTCGKRSKSTSKFCSQCGTSLEII